MTELEVRRIEALAKEIRALLPEHANVTIYKYTDRVEVGALYKDFPKVCEVVTQERNDYTAVTETIGDVVIGGIYND